MRLLPVAKQDDSLAVEDVFSTYLFKPVTSNTDYTITNGIDLAGEDGMVWIKARSSAGNNHVFDSLRGSASADANTLVTNSTSGEASTNNDFIKSFNSDGFDVGFESGGGSLTNNGIDYASWTFRKAPRFFDVVTYTGNNVAGRGIAHALGTTVGMMIIKDHGRNGTRWYVYHRSTGATKALMLGATDAASTATSYWNDTEPTTTDFTIGNHGDVNTLNQTYVAYLFADDPLGKSGDGSDGMIACGSISTNGSTGNVVSLGWEPQYVIVKSASLGDWVVFDSMRGHDGSMDHTTPASRLFPNLAALEDTAGYTCRFGANGFDLGGNIGAAGDYIYMAIRRPMKIPESASEVFAVDSQTSGTTLINTGWAVDTFFRCKNLGEKWIGSRLVGGHSRTDETAIEAASTTSWDESEGFLSTLESSFSKYTYMWKRAPNFFDVVAYTGDGIAGRTVNHNLGVEPEMVWVKSRSGIRNWAVYHSGTGNGKEGYVNLSNDFGASAVWANTTPTGAMFYVSGNNQANRNGETYIAYLFATLTGIAKVGSFTGNGASQIINCGFTAGARFVLIKSVTDTGNWLFWDTTRGIVAGDDPHLALNSTVAEITTNDSIDTDNSGFIVNLDSGASSLDRININTKEYIYYAIA